MKGCVCTVDVSPEQVDAGAELTLGVRVSGLPDDVGTPSVCIRDRDGVEFASAPLAAREAGEALEADGIVLPSPHAVGDHVWRAVVIAADREGALQERTSTDVRIVVTAHAAMLTVWDIPPTIVAGERFRFMIGVRCSAGCRLAGRTLSIVDQNGVQVGMATLSQTVWPGTEALHFAEVEAKAAPEAGQYQWQVRTDSSDTELPHEPGLSDIALRVVNPPDCAVTIETFDRETQTPIAGVTVVLHPYRTITDGSGAARMKVTRGEYDVLVSAAGYIPAAITLDIAADTTTRAELDVEPSGSEEEGY